MKSTQISTNCRRWGPIPGGPAKVQDIKGRSTATSALGNLLSMSNHHGVGVHGSTPSHTSRFFSIDFGLVHVVALDLNVYFGVDPCGDACRKAQLKWLNADLASAEKNREAVPWIVVLSHYPFYCTGCANKQVSSAFYASDEAETQGNANVSASVEFDLRYSPNQQPKRLSQSSDAAIADLVPILTEHKVDLYIGECIFETHLLTTE